MLERDFQPTVIKAIERRMPEAIVTKIDPYIQGIPDLLILFNDRWAMLECKKDRFAKHRPNQDYYIDILDRMSFAAFIYPENMEEILDAMEQSLRSKRHTRVSKSKSV